MARRTPGGIVLYLFDLKGRRRAAAALRSALPETDGGERRRLLRAAYAAERLRKRNERRAVAASPVELCRRIRFEGWEHLSLVPLRGNRHDTPGELLFLLAPFGSPAVAARVPELYHEGSASVVVLPPPPGEEEVEAPLFRRGIRCSERPARLALEKGLPAVWTLALPEPRGRWTVCFLPPVLPRPDDTTVSLSARYLGVLETRIRLRPEDWPWRHLG